MKYDVEYFFKKFNIFPQKNWGITQPTNCAYGQCRSELCKRSGSMSDGHTTEEGQALTALFSTLPNLTLVKPYSYLRNTYTMIAAKINDGYIEQYQQPTSKERILAALWDVKCLQKAKTVYVAVPETVLEMEECLN